MYIKVKVIPKSKADEIERLGQDSFKVKVKALAKNNEANKAVIALVADFFHLPEGKIRLISGHHSPSKILDVML